MADVADLIREVAATYVVPRFQNLADGEVETKSGPEDLVTIADREAEEALTPRLRDLLPGSYVVGEEAVAANPAVLRHLSTSDPVWLVDPVDGTRNFVQGDAKFAVMVALVQAGVPQAAWIFPPVENVMATAQRGGGAHVDGVPITGRRGRPFAQAFGDYSSIYVDPPWRDHFTTAFQAAGGTGQRHCSAYAYLDTARGEQDFVLQYRMSPWDHAAGALMVTEAGGAVRFLDDGTPYTAMDRASRPMLAVSDAANWGLYVDNLPRRL